MKYAMLIFIVSLSTVCHAVSDSTSTEGNSSVEREIVLSEKSLVSRERALELNKILMNIPSNDKIENIRVLNESLKKMNLPTINTETSVQLEMARSIGYSGSSIVGASFDDGAHKFCLPCEIGHNNFKFGVFPYIYAPE